jgi:hypothetical protein
LRGPAIHFTLLIGVGPRAWDIFPHRKNSTAFAQYLSMQLSPDVMEFLKPLPCERVQV